MPRRGSILLALCLTIALAEGLAIAAEPAAATPRGPLAGPLADAALAARDRFVFDGDVEERIEAGEYVYLRVDGQWVVSLRATTTTSARVRVTAIGRTRDFASRRLGRRFDDLIFGMVRAADPAAHEEE